VTTVCDVTIEDNRSTFSITHTNSGQISRASWDMRRVNCKHSRFAKAAVDALLV
jgi:hypothetical protein